MTEAPLMNDDQARSTTGEILDQSTVTPPTPTSTETPAATTTSTETVTPAPTTEPEAPTAPAKAPDAYTDFKAPDGYTLSKDALDAALPVFKELGLTQDQAQKLVDIQIQRDLAAAKAPQSAYETLRTDWQAKTKSDSELLRATNGNAVGLDAVKLDIGRAYAALPPALATEMKAAMDLTGAGDHPAIIKGLWKLAAFVTEGKHVAGGGPSPAGQAKPGSAPPTAAAAMYPNLPRAS